jgi:uncharacterized membrane protein YqaE (UPF0057 family)
MSPFTIRTPAMSASISTGDLIRVILSVIIPPLGVFLQEGLGKHFWINLILTLLGYVPGLVHAVWILARR